MKILFLIIFLSTFFIVSTSLSAPNTGRSGGGGTGDVANPMTQDLNLGGFDLTAGGAATFSGVTVNDNPGSNSLLLLDNPTSLDTCAPGAGNVQIFSDAGVLSACTDNGTVSIIAGTRRVLLYENIQSVAAGAVVATSVNWPATYAAVELELVNISPVTAQRMRFAYRGGQTSFSNTADITVMSYTTNGSSSDQSTAPSTLTYDNLTGLRIQSDPARLISTNAAYALNGTIRFHVSPVDVRSLIAIGSWTYGSSLAGSPTVLDRSVSTTLYSNDAFNGHGFTGDWDSIKVDMSTAVNFTGTVRLWGILKQ